MPTSYPRKKNTKHMLVRGHNHLLEDDGDKLITPQVLNAPTLPTAVGTLAVVSSSGSDTAGASKKVIVDYLNASWQERRAVFLINGTTTVNTDSGGATISAIRINRVWCNFANVGRVDASIGGTVLHQVPASQQLGATCMYTVPAGQQAVLHGIHVSAHQVVQLRLLEHAHGETTNPTTIWTWSGTGSFFVPFGYPRRCQKQLVDDSWLDTKLTYYMVGNCLTADVTSNVSVGLDFEIQRTDSSAVGFRA